MATLQGIQGALPVTCGAPGLDWPRGDLQSNGLCPQLACLPGPAAPFCQGPFLPALRPILSVQPPSSAPLPQCTSFILPSPPCSAAVTTVQQEPGWRPPHRGRVSPLAMCLPSTHLALPVVQSHRMMLPQDHPLSPLSCPAPAHQPCSKRAPAATAQQQATALATQGCRRAAEHTARPQFRNRGLSQTRGRPVQAGVQTAADPSADLVWLPYERPLLPSSVLSPASV